MQEYINKKIKRALKDYDNAYNHISNMDITPAYELLIKLQMNYGLCNYFSYNYYMLKHILEIATEHKIYNHWWKTPSDYYFEKEHPKLGLIPRIQFLKTLC